MKRRTLAPYKILAVALGAASCTKPATGPAPVAVAPASEQVSSPAADVRDAAPVAPAATAAATAAIVAAPLDGAARAALRSELARDGRDAALAHPERYRALCDADGYPLVGNMARKAPEPDYTPSAFCADVRARAAK